MSAFMGTITEDMEGEDLAMVISRYWNVGAGSMLYLDELVQAAEDTNVSCDRIVSVISSINAQRGHDYDTDVLEHAFVPAANVQAVHDLLDSIITLCVRM